MNIDILVAFLIGFFLGNITGLILTALVVAKNINGRDDDFDEDEF